MPYHVYIIRSAEGFRYIGHTGDLDTRLADHNRGRNHSTKHGSGWELIHQEEFSTRGEAVTRERWLKTGVGRKWIAEHIAGWSPPEAE